LVLKDDRFLKNCSRFIDELHEAVASVADTPRFIWDRIAYALALDSDSYEHDTLYAMLRSYGFMWRDCFIDGLRPPFNMAVGDIADNVHHLKNTDPELITHPHLRQIKRMLCEDDVPEHEVVESLELLQDMPCSTALVEEAHAAGKNVMQKHVQYSENSLKCKSLLLASRPLVRRPGATVAMRRIDRNIASLKKKRPCRKGGFHVRVAEQIKKAKPSIFFRTQRGKEEGCPGCDRVLWQGLQRSIA